MNESRISVIIPVYNVENYIEDCLSSVFRQTVPFDEIIIVNDGSTDGSGKICREYQSAHPEIILIEQNNMGLSEARNNGMKRASGDYIAFVDSDDWVSERMCETIKKTIADYDVDVVYYASRIVKEIPIKISYEAYARDEAFANIVMSGFDSLKKLFPDGYQMSAVMAAYRSSFLKENHIDFIKDILYEDRYFSLRVITEAQKAVYITDKLYIRRFRKSSICTSPASRKKIRDVLYGHKKEWEYIRNNKRWNSENKLTQYYAIRSAVMAYQTDVSSEEMPDLREEYMKSFFMEWLDFFEIDYMDENELCELLLMVNEAAKSGCPELTDLFGICGGIYQYQQMIRDLLLEKSKAKLKKLPLGERKKIAFYGAGKHTDCLFKLYRNLIGGMIADVCLIVSSAHDIDSCLGIDVKALDEVTDNWDMYVLSSKLYQAEMYQNLLKKSIPEEKIYGLYNKNDAVDCVMLYQALFEQTGELSKDAMEKQRA